MGSLFGNTRRPETTNVECKQSPIFGNESKNRGSIYINQNYAHRCNADGSFDSICLHCLQTVASASIDAALAQNEMEHRCIALNLKVFEAGRAPGSRPSSI
jgi:hypothetical protein